MSTSALIEIACIFIGPVLGYAMGRAHGRLLHIDQESRAASEGYQAGVKHGLEAGIMSGAAKARQALSHKRRGVVLGHN